MINVNNTIVHQTENGTYLRIGSFEVQLLLEDTNDVESLSVSVGLGGHPIVTNYVSYEGTTVGAIYTKKKIDELS